MRAAFFALLLILIESRLVLSLYVPSVRVADANWNAAVEKGSRVLEELAKGCYPDTVDPITREDLVAIGYQIGNDDISRWPPTWGMPSTWDELAIKMFKWTVKQNGYWKTSINRVYFSPWHDPTTYGYEFSPRNGLLTSLDIKQAAAETVFWPDMTFAMWNAVTAVSGNNIKNLRFISHHGVGDAFTQSIINRIVEGKAGTFKVVGQRSQSLAALLGTPRGVDTAKFLMQHKRQLGVKSIMRAVVFGKTQSDWDRQGPDVVFEIHEGSPQGTNDLASANATSGVDSTGLCRELANLSGADLTS
ncbi:MAG: hypothetical protein Q9222_003294 [Ikaeria aurantiellina]